MGLMITLNPEKLTKIRETDPRVQRNFLLVKTCRK